MEISAIYKKDKLFKVDSTPATRTKSGVTKPINFNGVAVLYEYRDAELLPAEMETFLHKVIEAGIKLIPAETIKANLNHADITLQQLAEQIGAKKVVIFGTAWIETLRNGQFAKNEICQLYGMKVLITDTLDVIHTNDNAKKIFWGHLKKMF